MPTFAIAENSGPSSARDWKLYPRLPYFWAERNFEHLVNSLIRHLRSCKPPKAEKESLSSLSEFSPGAVLGGITPNTDKEYSFR